jgi:hypothetical protein
MKPHPAPPCAAAACAAAILIALLAASLPSSAAPPIDSAAIQRLVGAKGSFDGPVFKVSVPRADLSIRVGAIPIAPAMGLTSWAAFQREGPDDLVMGDLVVTEDQIGPVMDAALDNGLEVTALHNHFAGESPRVMFMHVGGMGPEPRLAAAVGRVFAALRATPARTSPIAPIDPARSSLDPARLDSVLRLHGRLQDGIYKFTAARTTRMHDIDVGGAMGVNTWGAFAGSENLAVVDGDFAMRESELQPVLHALRSARIDVVAIHQHMIGEQPRIVFLHYWGVGPAASLARALRAALDLTRD